MSEKRVPGPFFGIRNREAMSQNMKQYLEYPVTYLERIKERGDVWVGDVPTFRQMPCQKNQPSSIFEKHHAGRRPNK
jgi:hypothetical protein